MILQLKDIRISFTNAQNESFDLLRGVNLDVEKGKITALVGGNGTGKTTLFNIISGFEKSYTGEVVFEGNDFNRIPAQRQMEIKMHKKVIVCEYCGRILIDPELVGISTESAKNK